MVHVAPLDAGGARCMRLLQCEQDTTVAELKAMARSAPQERAPGSALTPLMRAPWARRLLPLPPARPSRLRWSWCLEASAAKTRAASNTTASARTGSPRHAPRAAFLSAPPARAPMPGCRALEVHDASHLSLQVAGFVVNPVVAGKKYVDGVLVAADEAEPDYDAYPSA